MKSDMTVPQSRIARRGWLGGLAAGLGALFAWKSAGPAAPLAEGPAARQPDAAPAMPNRPALVVRPAPDSVKRHG